MKDGPYKQSIFIMHYSKQLANSNASKCVVLMSWLMIPNASARKTNKSQLVDIIYVDHWFDCFLFLADMAFGNSLSNLGRDPTCGITLEILFLLKLISHDLSFFELK